MAKFQSPLLGYNNNVRHKNRVFHIQTEDSGVNHPHIITHLFMDGGRILKSVKKSYAEHVGADGMSEIVRGLMKEQHKAMFIALRDGQFDHIVDPNAAKAAAAASPTVDAAVVTAAAVDPNPAPVPPPADSTEAVQAAAAAASGATTDVATDVDAPVAMKPEVVEVAAASSDLAAASAASPAGPPTNPQPTLDLDLPPVTIDESKRPTFGSSPPSAAYAKSPRISDLPPPPSLRGGLMVPAYSPPPVIARVDANPDSVPVTTRQPPEARPDAAAASATGRELTLDFEALERAAQDSIQPSSLFHASELPPPPKNLFSARERDTGGAYRAIEPDPRDGQRHDPREESGGRSGTREETAPASSRGGIVGRHHPAAARSDKAPSPTRGSSSRAPASRPAGEARYAPARPAAIFGSAQRPPQSQSIFSDELVSDKSLDEVILSYLAEDLDPPNRK